MRLAGIASATVSKFAIAVPPRFLISSTPSSAGVALEPEPSAAPPGSLTTTFAPSAAQSSAISLPMPRPAPVTTMDLPSSVLAMSLSLICHSGMVRRTRPGISRFRVRAEARPGMTLILVGEDDRARCREHAADAMAHRDLCVRHLRRRDAAHLPHAFLQCIHAVHARMHIGEAAAIGVERQLAAGPRVGVGAAFGGPLIWHEAEIAQAIERQVGEGVIDHQMIDVLVRDPGLAEGERSCHLEGA